MTKKPASRVKSPSKHPRTKPAAAPSVPPTPQGDWFRLQADLADQGIIKAYAAVTVLEGRPPATAIFDNGADRLVMIGSLSQLAHMLNTTEQNVRMEQLARRIDPASILGVPTDA